MEAGQAHPRKKSVDLVGGKDVLHGPLTQRLKIEVQHERLVITPA